MSAASSSSQHWRAGIQIPLARPIRPPSLSTPSTPSSLTLQRSRFPTCGSYSPGRINNLRSHPTAQISSFSLFFASRDVGRGLIPSNGPDLPLLTHIRPDSSATSSWIHPIALWVLLLAALTVDSKYLKAQIGLHHCICFFPSDGPDILLSCKLGHGFYPSNRPDHLL